MISKAMDTIDARIIAALAANARVSHKELSVLVGLSAPSVAERMKRLQERGIIRGFTLDVDPAALGLTLQAIVRIRPLPGKVHIVEALIQNTPEITECDKVTGDDCFVARLCVHSLTDLDRVLGAITEKAATSTAIVKSSAIPRRLPPVSTG